jgi:hypothetical protein
MSNESNSEQHTNPAPGPASVGATYSTFERVALAIASLCAVIIAIACIAACHFITNVLIGGIVIVLANAVLNKLSGSLHLRYIRLAMNVGALLALFWASGNWLAFAALVCVALQFALC